jgi:GGDEF domain-containing protein
MRGDQVIQFSGRLIQEVALAAAGPDTFVGHVGGDDFVVVCQADKAERVAEQLAERFDREAPALYDEEDRVNGYIEIANRQGEQQRFPIISLSIGVATTAKRGFAHYAEAVAIATEMKSFTKKKMTPGSSWAVDRRTT